MLVATTNQLHFSEQFSSTDAISLDIANVLEILACSRLSDSGEGAKEWERCESFLNSADLISEPGTGYRNSVIPSCLWRNDRGIWAQQKRRNIMNK